MRKPLCTGRVAVVAALLAAMTCAGGCSSQPEAPGLAELKDDEMKSLLAQCFIANRDVLVQRNAPDVRLACRAWAQAQVYGGP